MDSTIGGAAIAGAVGLVTASAGLLFQRLQHDREVAEARRGERAATYLLLVDVIGRGLEQVEMTNPDFQVGAGPPQLPELPPESLTWELTARVKVLGSMATRDLVDEWSSEMTRFNAASNYLSDMRHRAKVGALGDGENPAELAEAVRNRRLKLRAIHQSIVSQVRSELGIN